MADLGERITAVEVSLREHLRQCERKHEKAFRINLVVLAAILAALVKLYWPG